MTQKSWPWGYLLGDDSLVGYTAKEDASLYAALVRGGGMIVDNGIRTLAAFANMGIFCSVAGRFGVTSGGDNDITVGSGAALCAGEFYYNSADFGTANNITSPAANPRVDRIVIRTNYSAAAYVPAKALAADFTVPAYTTRVTVIHGIEGGGAPALTQDVNRATYWDIPVYQYTISVAGVISALTDERTWVDAEEKLLLVPCTGGYNVTDGAYAYENDFEGFRLIDAKNMTARGSFIVPRDFYFGMSIEAVVYPAGSGNLRNNMTYKYGACGAAGTTVVSATVDEAVTTSIRNCIAYTVVAGVSAADIISLSFSREGAHANDTVGADVDLLGFRVSYIGWR